jgi:hypothetical protein
MRVPISFCQTVSCCVLPTQSVGPQRRSLFQGFASAPGPLVEERSASMNRRARRTSGSWTGFFLILICWVSSVMPVWAGTLSVNAFLSAPPQAYQTVDEMKFDSLLTAGVLNQASTVQLKAIPPARFAELQPKDVYLIEPSTFGRLTLDQVGAFSVTSALEMSPSQIAGLDPDVLNRVRRMLWEIFVDRCSSFTPEQIRHLDPDRFGTLCVTSGSGKKPPICDLDASVFKALRADQTRLLSTETIEHLGEEQVQSLTAQDLSPDVVGGLSAAKLADFLPEQIAGLAHSGRRLTAKQLHGFSQEQVQSLDVSRLQPSVLAKVSASPRWMKKLKPDQIRGMNSEQIASLNTKGLHDFSVSQFEALDAHLREATGTTPMERTIQERAAIDPGIRLIGDAEAQLVKAADANDASTSFGGGIEAEQTNWYSKLVIRRGSNPDTLEGTEQFGLSLLNPAAQRFYFGFGARHFKEVKHRHGWQWGEAFQFDTGMTEWRIRDARDRKPPIDSTWTATSRAVAFALRAGAASRYLLADKGNTVEVNVVLPIGIRWVSLGADADQRVADALAKGAQFASGSFKRIALGVRHPVFLSFDPAVELRINSVVLQFTLPMVTGSVAGLSKVSFDPSIRLRAGAKIASL